MRRSILPASILLALASTLVLGGVTPVGASELEQLGPTWRSAWDGTLRQLNSAVAEKFRFVDEVIRQLRTRSPAAAVH